MDRASIQERFGIIGTSAAIRHVLDQVRLVASTDASVLIQGESGVGKEVIAKTIHELSNRRHQRTVIVNCGAIPEGLIESELFGNEKGAYTGAVEKRAGFFEEADKGTIFLDEIGEMPLAAQVRLLRVLETGAFSRVGSAVVKNVDVRVVAATNKDLSVEVREGRFREDLYYRLSTVVIEIPPLRRRREDILPLFEKFLHDMTQEYQSTTKTLDDGARELILQYRWPGNVRELKNVAERAVVLHRGSLLTETDVRPHLRGVSASGTPGGLVALSKESTPGPDSARERELIYRALLELRMEIRDLKTQIGQLARGRTDSFDSPEESDYVIVEAEDDTLNDIEEAPYEIDNFNGAASATALIPVSASTSGESSSVESDEILTLEEVERNLIIEALNRFEGNRRQTAKALGISERTLYRKIREIEEDTNQSLP